MPNSGKRATAKGPTSDLTRSLESRGRIWTNIPKSALKTRGVRLRSNAAYVYNAGGVDSGWLCDPKRTYDPRARRISRALERIDGANTAANSSAKGARVRACPRRVRDRRPWSGRSPSLCASCCNASRQAPRHEFKLTKLSAFMRARRMAQSSIFLRRVGRTFG